MVDTALASPGNRVREFPACRPGRCGSCGHHTRLHRWWLTDRFATRRQIVQTRFLIVKRTTAADVKLSRRILAWRRRRNKRRSLRDLAAIWVAGTIVHYQSSRDALAGKAGGIHCDGRCSRAAQQSRVSGANGPRVIKRSRAVIGNVCSEGDHLAFIYLSGRGDIYRIGTRRLGDWWWLV